MNTDGGMRRQVRQFSTALILLVLVVSLVSGTVSGVSEKGDTPLNPSQDTLDNLAGDRGAEPVTDVITVGENGTYDRLQVAIDNADDGDTIQVESGTYYQVRIEQSITLVGIDTGGGKPVIDARGNGPCVSIGAEGVTIEGFELTNMGDNSEGGVKTTEDGGNARIVNNSFTDGDIALNLRDRESGHEIYLNDFSDVDETVIYDESRRIDLDWNSSAKITYWWNGEEKVGSLGNYYGSSTTDNDGDGIGESSRGMGLYPWNNSDFAPLVDKPWKYFDKNAGESASTDSGSVTTFTTVEQTTTSTTTDTPRTTESSQPETTEEEEMEESSTTRTVTTVEDTTDERTSTERPPTTTERKRGFFTNSDDGPPILDNMFNLTMLGFLLSVAGILHQMLGGR